MQTLIDLYEQGVALGSREAVRDTDAYRIRVTTYAELDDLVARVASLFARLEIAEGDRVLVWGENCVAWAAAFWTCATRGVVCLPVDARPTPELVSRICSKVEPRLLLHDATVDVSFADVDVLPSSHFGMRFWSSWLPSTLWRAACSACFL